MQWTRINPNMMKAMCAPATCSSGATQSATISSSSACPRTLIYYYLKRGGRWPIGNLGGDAGKLIASKRRLIRYAEKLTRGGSSAA